MFPKAIPLVSNTVFRGTPNGSHVFIGSFEWPVPTSVSGLFRLKSFWPRGVSGGISPRSGVRLPAHEPLMSWTGAGPPVVVSGFNLLPLYKLSFPGSFGFADWAMAADVKANMVSKPTMDRTSKLRIFEPLRIRGWNFQAVTICCVSTEVKREGDLCRE